jgi:glycine cleavage system H protein
LTGKQARIGVTDYAQDALGDVVFVQLPIVGESLPAGATCSEVESTKSVSDVYTPVAGTISNVNETLVENPGLINSDPYVSGWIFEIAVDDAASGANLLDASAYRQLIEG